MRPRRNKRDANESDLLTEVRKIGCDWHEAGPLDGWVWAPCGRFPRQWVPVEVKNPGGRNRFQDGQKEFIALCEQTRRPHFVWRTLDDCIRDLTGDPEARVLRDEDCR